MITSSDVCGPGHQLSKLLLLEIPWRMKMLDKASAEYNIHITHVEKGEKSSPYILCPKLKIEHSK